jgi:hypothetical protein
LQLNISYHIIYHITSHHIISYRIISFVNLLIMLYSKLLTESFLGSLTNCVVHCRKHCCDPRSRIFTCKCSETTALSPVGRQKLVPFMINFTLCSPPRTFILPLPLLACNAFRFFNCIFLRDCSHGTHTPVCRELSFQTTFYFKIPFFPANCTFRCSVDFPLVVEINTCL